MDYAALTGWLAFVALRWSTKPDLHDRHNVRRSMVMPSYLLRDGCFKARYARFDGLVEVAQRESANCRGQMDQPSIVSEIDAFDGGINCAERHASMQRPWSEEAGSSALQVRIYGEPRQRPEYGHAFGQDLIDA